MDTIASTSHEPSRDGRFRLVRITDTVDARSRLRVRLELAATSVTVLDLSDPAADIEIAAFDRERNQLHLRISHLSRSLVRYPATVDLDTGLYYHGDPRQAHGPVGHASELEDIARTGRTQSDLDRSRPVRWPVQSASAPPQTAHPARTPASAEPALPPSRPEPPPMAPSQVPDCNESFDRSWRLEWSPSTDSTRQVRITGGGSDAPALDLSTTPWDCKAGFLAGSNTVILNVHSLDGSLRLGVRIDLDCAYYWEASGEDLGMLRWEEEGTDERTSGVQAAPLAELQLRLTHPSGVVQPALRSRTTGPMWPRWAVMGEPPPALVPPRPPAPAPAPSRAGRPPCTLSCIAFTSAHDGRSLIHATIAAGDTNEPLISTLGTRWDLHGHELNGSERVLHLHHADDPLLHRTISIWPIGSASFGDIDECRPAGEIQAALVTLDAEARARPRGVGPGAAYKPPEPFVIDQPRYIERYWKGETDYEEIRPTPGPAASEHVVETNPVEFAPHRWADELRLKHPGVTRPIFDLFNSGWFGEAHLEGPAWDFNLEYPSNPTRSLRVLINPSARTAKVNGLGGALPIRFVELHLTSFMLHDQFEVMLEAIARGPAPAEKPELRIPLADGPLAPYLEFWRTSLEGRDFLQPRIVGPTGTADLDLRATRFTLFTFERHTATSPLYFRLARIGADFALEEFTSLYQLHPAWRRISRRGLAGSTALSLLHVAALALGNGKTIDARLEGPLRAGNGLPIG